MRTRSKFFWPALTVVTVMFTLSSLAVASLGAVAFAGTSPTISSDKPDYFAGDTVTLSGAGWDAGEAVHIFVNDNDGQTWSYNADVTADDQGGFTDSFQLPNWFVATYNVTTTGASSGTATTTFTDAQLTAKAAPVGATFTLTWTKYTGANCTGTASLGGTPTIDSTGTNLNFSTANSVSLAAPASSNEGGTFSSWSGGTPFGTRTVCTNVPTGGTQLTLTATFSAPPTHNTSTSVVCSPNPVAEGNNSTCEATVTDTTDGTVTPIGSISFSSDAAGTFPSGNTCTLATSGPNAGKCSKGYHPSAGSAGTHHITATYTPDNTGYRTWNGSNNSPGYALTVTGSDTTPPDTFIDTTPTNPSGSASATFTFHGTDNVTPAGSLSFQCDLDGGGFSSCTSGQSYSSLSASSHTFQVRAIDAATNVDATPASYTWTIDLSVPTVNCTVPDNTIWYGADVTVPCTASDPSGLADPGNDASFNLTTSVSSGTETASASTNSNQVCDTVNNCTTAGPYTFKIDKKAPVLSSCDSPDGLWHATDVTLYCHYTDGGSGPATQDVALSTSVAAGSETSNASASAGGAQACDNVSNCATSPADITGNKIDKKAPTVTCQSPAPTFLLNQAGAQVSATVADGGSGYLASPVYGSADTSSVGAKTVSITGYDNVGNFKTQACAYNVVYDFNGFFSPVDNPAVFNVVKAGSAIPVKFSLDGNQGLGILNSGYPKSHKIDCNSSADLDSIEQTVTAGYSTLNYDPTADQYIYVWKTDKTWAGTCRQFDLGLSDGANHYFLVKFTK